METICSVMNTARAEHSSRKVFGFENNNYLVFFGIGIVAVIAIEIMMRLSGCY